MNVVNIHIHDSHPLHLHWPWHPSDPSTPPPTPPVWIPPASPPSPSLLVQPPPASSTDLQEVSRACSADVLRDQPDVVVSPVVLDSIKTAVLYLLNIVLYSIGRKPATTVRLTTLARNITHVCWRWMFLWEQLWPAYKKTLEWSVYFIHPVLLELKSMLIKPDSKVLQRLFYMNWGARIKSKTCMKPWAVTTSSK